MPLPASMFNSANTLYTGLAAIQLKLTPALTGVTAATDTITKTAHGLVVGQTVVYNSGTGFTGLVAASSYYVVAVPTADTFKVSATLGGASITVGTSSAGSFQPVIVFYAQQLDDDPEMEVKKLERPDSAGVLRPIRSIRTKSAEKWSFGIEDVKLLPVIFSGALSGRKTGTCTLWFPDLDDAGGTVSLKSEADFACTVVRDGKVQFGGGEYSKATIRVESNKSGEVTWTVGGAA